MRNADLYRNSFPLAQPEDAHWTDRVVTQGHADYCAEYGHATWTQDGITRTFCPRCGDAVTPPAHRVATDAGRNVRCVCGSEYSETANLRRHIARETGTPRDSILSGLTSIDDE